MQKKILLIVLLTIGFSSQAQLIVNNTQTPAQLVQNVLLGTGVVATNITFNGSAVNANLLRDQAGHFLNGATTNIGIDQGVILSTGKGVLAIGPNNAAGSTNATSNPDEGDADLDQLTTNTVRNKAILEFDFIPTGQTLSFDFVFASEEYPEWANSNFNDVFGFFLSGPGIMGPYSNNAINIALIPSTTVPITINNLNNGTTNTGPCEYCAFYVNNGTGSTPAVNSTIQYDGFTVVIPATATVQCGQLYHIKLAIANVGDNSLDSAVFLKANSFNSAPIDFPTDYLVSNGFAPCYGSSTQICTGLASTIPHIWTLDGDVLVGETAPCLTITQPGEYCATAFPYGPACPVSDCLTVEFQDPIAIGNPNTLTACDTLFNLTNNAAVIMNGLDVTLSYYTSASNAEQLLNPITNPTNYTGFDGQTIYVAVEDNTTGCLTSTQFNLDIIICTSNPIPGQPPNLALCESSFGSGTATFNLVPQTPIVLASNAAADYTVTYHLTQNGADNNTGAISPVNVPGTNGQIIYVRLEENADTTHYTVVTFQLIVNPIPTATISVAPSVVCMNDTATVTFTGTPNAIVTYNFDSNPNQTITLNASGSASIVTPPLTSASTYNLVSIQQPVTNCSQPLTGSATVTVNALPTATISGTTTICSGSTTVITFNGTANATVTYTVNGGSNQTIPLNASGVATLTTPALTADTTYALVSVTSAGTPACSQAQTGSALVTIIALPTATISGSTTICSGNTAVITFSGTPNATVTYTINGGSNQSIALGGAGSATVTTPVLTANSTYALVSVSLPGTPACGQNVSGSAVVTVNPLPVITNVPANMVVCSGDTVTTSAFVSSPAGANFTWTNSNPSIGLAASGVGNIPTFTASNSGPSVTATITVTATLNNCTTTGSYTITVNPVPAANPVIGDYELCDYNSPGDGFEVFTLNSMDTEIANGQTNVTISYYLTQSDAQNQTSPLPNLYTNISNPQIIWINISNNATGCDAVSSFNLVVNPLPQANTPEPIFQCSNGATTQAEFNLTINEGAVTAGNTAPVTVSYYNTMLDAQNETSPILLPSAYMGTDNEIVYIRVENDATGCYATTTQLLRVTQGPIAITPTPLHYCDPNNDGLGVFDLESASTQIAGGVWPLMGVSITYHETETDALLGANPKPSPYENIEHWAQTIYVRVFYTLTGCANYVQLQLIVDPTPEATEPDDYLLCDTTGQVGYEPFDLTTTVPQVLGSINPADVTVTFHTTFAGAQNETNTITGVTSYVNATQWTQTVYVRVEFNTTGCYDIVELDLIVNPLPNATQPNYPQYTLCDNSAPIGYEVFDLASQVDAILLGQQGMTVTFYPSLAQAQAQAPGTSINETYPTLQYTNVPPFVQTLGIVITNSTTGCYSISTMDIRVVPLPTPIPPSEPYTICDENQDGYSGFDLASLVAEINLGGYIITFHETQTDAENGDNDIDTTVLYENIDAFTQIIYVRAEDPNTGCVTVMPIVLNVNPSPIAPIDLDDIVVCDQDSNTQNAITRVDLTVRTPDALAQQPLAASNYTVTYHNSLSNAQNDIPIIPANDYNATNNQTIWLRVEDNTTGCYNIGTFDIIINIPLLLTTPTPLSLCDDDASPNDQHHSFDLTVRDVMITQGLSGYTVTYYPSYALALLDNPANAIATPTAYTNVPNAVQTLGVVVTSAAGCKSYTTLDIRVLPIPTPNTNPPSLGAKCDDNNPGDMMELFDLTVNAAYILNGDPNLTLHYYHSEADALVPQNEILNPTNALVGDVDPTQQSVWIRVENNRVDYQGNHCFVLVEQPLTVNPLPAVVQPLAPYRMCDDDTDGIAQFDLNNPLLATAILGTTQSPADFTITYYLTAAGANPLTNTGETPLVSPYTNVTPDSQDIYIRVVNNATGCVNATGVLTLAVEEYATATGPQAFSSCDDYNDPYDGVFQLDLTQYEAAILNGQDATIFLISYYHSQSDAEQGINAIPLAEAQAYITQPDTDQIWVKVENSSNSITPFCYALTTIDIEIERYPNPIITTPNGVTTICVDFTSGDVVRPLVLDSNIPNPADYTFEWYEDGSLIAGATGSTYTVNTSSPTGATRNYTVRVISNSPLLCETTSAGFDVIQSGQASIPMGTAGYTVTNAFTDSQIITVTVEGWGTYEYSLDDGPRQASNIFEGVSLGSHTIHVWDTEGGIAFSCEELIIEDVQVIDYPHYFTPNGDGIHDTWNVVGLDNFDNVTKIYIFDRYGKLLKQLSSSGDGWDGTFNGHMLPSTDYWFTVDYPENGAMKQFKAHFTLKR